MSLFWAKKSKSTKNYDQNAQAVKSGAGKVVKAKAVKAVKATKELATTSAPAVSSGIVSNIAGAILRPRLTEKSGILSQMGVYTFEIAQNANKNAVSKAVSALYKVTPIKIAILNLPSKRVFVRGKRGVVSGIRKAVVTLKKGDKIDFV